MRHRTKIIFESNMFKFVKHSHPKTNKSYYTIETIRWWYIGSSYENKTSTLKDIRQFFDPGGNRGSKCGAKWKFRNKKIAEQLLTIAIIRWSS